MSSLTEDLVRSILKAPGAQIEIAQRFGVGKSTVARIKLGQVWQHVTGGPKR